MHRDYDAESERQEGVENFYKTNHINQTYDFVSNSLISILICFYFCKSSNCGKLFDLTVGSEDESRIWQIKQS